MSVVVINADPGWQYASLVRQHAADLFRRNPEIAFWQALRAPAGDDTRSLWGDWPRQLLGSRAVLESELEAALQATLNSQVAFVFVLPAVTALDDGAGGPLDRELLERFSGQIGKGSVRAPRVLRLALIRSRPEDRNQRWRWDEIAAARGLVDAGLVDSVWFLSPPHDASPGGDFAALRLLVELLGGADPPFSTLRPLGRDRSRAVAWLRSFDAEPANHPAGARVLLTALVDEVKRTDGEADAEGDAGDSLTASVEALLQRIEAALGSQPSTPTLLHDAAAARLLERVPRYFEPGLAARLERAGDAQVTAIVQSIKERHDQLGIERRNTLTGYRNAENAIVAQIAQLQAGLKGRSASVLEAIAATRARVAKRAGDLRRQLAALREGIAQTALPLGAQGPGTSDMLQRLERYKELEKAVERVQRKAANLARRPAFIGFWATLVVAALGPPFAFRLADTPGSTGAEGLLGSLLGALPVTLHAGDLEAWPVAYWLFSVLVLGVGLATHWLHVKGPQRRLQAEASTLSTSIQSLYEQAHKALGNSIAYAELGYVLGWCALLDARLEQLADEIERQQTFDVAFNDLRRPGVADKGAMARLHQDLGALLRGRSRQEWLGLLLRNWPDAPLHEVELQGGSKLAIATRYLPHGFEPEEDELSLLDLVAVEHTRDRELNDRR